MQHTCSILQNVDMQKSFTEWN